ncbi:MAG TPA: hypothetical protein VFV40_04495 [Nocardioides sp.]|nr:hypothetical protein [Nocardioides sp.]
MRRRGSRLGLCLVTLLTLATPAAAQEVAHSVLFTFADRAVTESSGLVDAGDVVHTVNDSGSDAELFSVDARTGETALVTTYAEEVEDVEALAPAPDGDVWVADVGDNVERRDEVWVHRVTPGSSSPAPRFGLRYPGGPRDAETLLAHPRTGRLFVVSKTVFGGVVYAAPRRLVPGEVHRLRPFARVPGLLTDGAFFPDGEHVLVRGYATATVLTFPGFETVGSFPLPRQQQGEGLSIGPGGRVLVSSEGVNEDVLEVQLPREVVAALEAGPDAAPTEPPSAVPRPAPERLGASDAPWGWWAAGALGVGLAAVALLLLGQRRR